MTAFWQRTGAGRDNAADSILASSPGWLGPAAPARREGRTGSEAQRDAEQVDEGILGRAETASREGLGQLDAEVDQDQQQPRRQGGRALAQPGPGGGASRA
jgi:hypothetical protein